MIGPKTGRRLPDPPDRILTVRELAGMDRDPCIPTSFVPPGCIVQSRFDMGRTTLGHYDNRSGRYNYDALEELRPDDIIHVPLYGEWMDKRGRLQTTDPKYKVEAYDENAAFIREIASSVKAIVVGNDGPEFSGTEVWKRAESREAVTDAMLAFADDAGELIANAGGTPLFTSWAWDVAFDCYYGDGAFRDRLNEIGGGQACLCGYRLFAFNSFHMRVPVPSSPYCSVDEPLPKPQLVDYLRGADLMISGADGPSGLQRNSDIILALAGFDELIMGFPYPQTFEERWEELFGDSEVVDD
jgi:hypothetical protein